MNAVLPGFIATSIFGASLGLPREQADQMAAMLVEAGGSMQPAGRVGKGEDIAEMAAFLASDAASFITGGEFLVDGGMTVGPRHAWDETKSSLVPPASRCPARRPRGALDKHCPASKKGAAEIATRGA